MANSPAQIAAGFLTSPGVRPCSAAALDVLTAKGRWSGEEVLPGKDRLWSLVSMLVALLKANSDYRLHDRSAE